MIVRAGGIRGRRAQRPWYVDSVNGSDGRQGRSPSDALRTIAAVLPRIRRGDTVALATGSHWRESLSIGPDQVRVIAYGTGAKPLLDCSDIVAPGAWSKAAGLTNVYQASVALDGSDPAQFVSAWENDVRLVRASSPAGCDAQAGSYYPSSDSEASITLYIHASDHSDPGSNGKTYEYSRRQYGLAGANGIQVSGIHTRRNLHSNGSLMVYAHCSLTDCLASEGTKHSVYAGPGTRLTRVEADRAYSTGDGMMFVYNGANVSNGNVTFLDCHAHGYTGGTAAGFGGHSNDGSSFGAITWQGCRVEDCSRGFTAGNALAVTATGCTATEATEANAAALYAEAATVSVDSCTLTGKPGSGRAVQIQSDGAQATIRNSILGGNTSVLAMGNGSALTLEGNTFVNDGFCIYANGTSFSMHSSGNSFTSPMLYYYCDKAPALVASDHNTFVSPGTDKRFEIPAGTRLSLEEWKATGQDTHSTP